MRDRPVCESTFAHKLDGVSAVLGGCSGMQPHTPQRHKWRKGWMRLNQNRLVRAVSARCVACAHPRVIGAARVPPPCRVSVSRSVHFWLLFPKRRLPKLDGVGDRGVWRVACVARTVPATRSQSRGVGGPSVVCVQPPCCVRPRSCAHLRVAVACPRMRRA